MSRKLTPEVSVQRSRKISLPYHFQSWVLLHAHEKGKEKKNWNYKVSPTLLFHGAIILLSLSHFLIVYILSVLFNGYSKGGRRSLVHMRDGKRSLSLLCVVVNVSFHIRKVHTVNIFPKEKLFNWRKFFIFRVQ